MSRTRRDFLKLTTVGAGSLAAIGGGSDEATACCWRPSSRGYGRPRNGYGEPYINITFPQDGAHIGRTFTVYGAFYREVELDPSSEPVVCKLYKETETGDVAVANGTVTWTDYGTNSERPWMSDFTVPESVPAGASGLKVKADLVGTLKSAMIMDLVLFAESGPTQPPIIIETPGSIPNFRNGPIALKARPAGEIKHPRIEGVSIIYYRKGEPLSVALDLAHTQVGDKKLWRLPNGVAFNFQGHQNKMGVSFIATGTSTGNQVFTISNHSLTIAGS